MGQKPFTFDSMQIGQTVYLRNRIGDVDPVTKASVIVPRGTPARVIEFFEEQTSRYARLEMPTSPGQKTLRTSEGMFEIIWQMEKPPSCWSRVLDPEI